jgi:hypothetical protein
MVLTALTHFPIFLDAFGNLLKDLILFGCFINHVPLFLVSNSFVYTFSWQPLHQEVYNMHPSAFFIPTFLEAVRSNTEESLRSIMTEPTPGVYSFAMLQPNFCEMLLEEVC